MMEHFSPADVTTPTHGRILVVDDEEANLRLLTELLAREGFADVVATPEPGEALQLFDYFRPDLVLLDLHMPVLDGFSILGELRARTRPGEYLPVLVLTGDSSPATKLRALSGGATDFLQKPFDRVEVMLRIRQLLHTRELHRALQLQNAQLEQRVAERTRELEEALVHAEAAREAKVQFLAKMSHELRTPLNAMTGALELLRHDAVVSLPDAARRMVDLTGRNVERMTALINEILYLQSIEQGAVRLERFPMHVAPLVLELAERAESRVRAQGLNLHVDVPRDLVPLYGDAIRLTDVLWRLVDNAIRFTPAGEIRLVVDAHPDTRIPSRIDVVDTGVGIRPEQLEAVFAPFEQADNSSTRRFEGAGIGLALCRALCDRMGYRIGARSDLGRGSTFSVYLHRADDP